MPQVNPNTLTTTRIPNAVISSTSLTPGGTINVLRKTSNTGTPSKIVFGPKKGFQYIKAENWRAGLTPFDNGYYNDGISPGHDTGNQPWAPSRYWDMNYPSTIFEWWSKYVVYCHGGSTTGPNGNDNLEIFVANDSTELTNLTNNLIPAAGAANEKDALLAIADQDGILCVNTNYPNIPLHDFVGLNGATYSLKLLLDFGFIPSYPRGGTYSYDMSNNSGHNMTFTSTSNIVYEPESTSSLNCLGGCLKFTNNTSNDYGYISSPTDLYTKNTTINVWFRVNDTSSNRCLIDTSNGYISGPGGAGYQIWVTGNAVAVAVITTMTTHSWTSSSIITAGEWYNVTLTISTDPGNTSTSFSVVISDSVSYMIDANAPAVLPGGMPSNTNDFLLGIKGGSPLGNPFNSRVSVVSVYEGALSSSELESLWAAYAQCTPRPQIQMNGGRYISYP
jgi:hypothetical protein